LGTSGEFYKKFEKPILDGREPDATDKQLALAQERNGELSELVNKFVLRRTNTILSKHLPPKVVEVVCCKLSPLQQMIYRHFLSEKAAKTIATGKSAMVLAAITGLKKLCNHPKLIHDMITATKTTNKGAAGFESCADFFGDGLYDSTSGRGLGRERAGGGLPDGWETHSGKFAVLARLLAILRKETKDRIVIISNYTQTLDLIQTLCTKTGTRSADWTAAPASASDRSWSRNSTTQRRTASCFCSRPRLGDAGSTSSAVTASCSSTRTGTQPTISKPRVSLSYFHMFILLSYITRAIRLTSCFVYSAMLARRPEEEVLPVPFPRHRFHRGEGVPAAAQQGKFAERGERRRYAGAELDE
jgi:hypothetical protein